MKKELQMFHQLLIIIISYGLLQSVIHGRCIGDGCDKRQALKLLRFAPVNCHNQHHHTTVFCPNCAADKNVISDNCCNCCCNRISSHPCTNDNDDSAGDATVTATGCGLSTNCNSKGAIESDTSKEDDEFPTSAISISGKTSSQIKSNNPPAPCSCPTAPTSNPQQFSRNSNIGIFKKNITLPLLPPGVPIIPSPQLDLLTAGGNVKFSNIQNLRLPTIKPPLVKKPLAQQTHLKIDMITMRNVKAKSWKN
uniref:Uncharacterized protein n=1 Tax=Wuchereria bancrofti TaxID=6293 RepID=A0A1I8EPY6_WUCBA